MTDPACDKQQRIPSSTRSFIVEKCHRMATAQMINVPSVTELCQRLHVSRRTIQNSFHSVAEMTPLNYLRSVRLNGVRRTLMSTRAADLSIGDAAAQWGFYHLSHFAAPRDPRRLHCRACPLHPEMTDQLLLVIGHLMQCVTGL